MTDDMVSFSGWVLWDGTGRSNIIIVSEGGRMVMRVWEMGQWSQQGYPSSRKGHSVARGIIEEWKKYGFHIISDQITIEQPIRRDDLDLSGSRFKTELMDRIFKPFLSAAGIP